MDQRSLDSLSRLALLVFRADQALSNDGDRLAGAWGLTSAQWKVLGAIALSTTDPSAAAIGRAMGMTRQAAIKQIHLLSDQGLLQHKVDPADARAPVHALTRKGCSVYEQISAAWSRRAATLSAGLRTADLEGACNLLGTLLDRLEHVPATVRKRARK